MRMRLYHRQIARLVYKAKEGRHIRIWVSQLPHHDRHDITKKIVENGVKRQLS